MLFFTYFLCCSLLIFLCNGQNIAEYKAYCLMGAPILRVRISELFSVFSVMAGWIAEMLFMLFFCL